MAYQIKCTETSRTATTHWPPEAAAFALTYANWPHSSYRQKFRLARHIKALHVVRIIGLDTALNEGKTSVLIEPTRHLHLVPPQPSIFRILWDEPNGQWNLQRVQDARPNISLDQQHGDILRSLLGAPKGEALFNEPPQVEPIEGIPTVRNPYTS